MPSNVEAQASADDSMVALAEAALRFLRAIANNRGGVVVLEDLHWADPETLTIVEYLAGQPELRTRPIARHPATTLPPDAEALTSRNRTVTPSVHILV
jgi:predicted ATPase